MVNGSRPPSQRSSSRPDHLPTDVPLRTRAIHEGSRNSLPSRRPTVTELEEPGPSRREASSHPRPAELRTPSTSQQTNPRVTSTQPSSPLSPSPRNRSSTGRLESGNPQRSTSRTPSTHVPYESGDTPISLDPELETAINNNALPLTPLTEEEIAGLTRDQMIQRAISASTQPRVLAEGPLMEGDLAGMTEEQMIARAMMESNTGTILDDSRPPPNLTQAQITALDNEQIRRARDLSLADDPGEAAQQMADDELMKDLPRYHEIVGTWHEWHEMENGIEPGLRPKRMPEYDVPSGSELTYMTTFAPEIPLEQAMIISNRYKDEYWNRVKRGEITDTGTSQGLETSAERKLKGAQQKKHLEAVAKMPTAKDLEKRWGEGNPVSQEATSSQETAEQSGQGGERAMNEAFQSSGERPAHGGGGEAQFQSISQLNARGRQRREQINVQGVPGSALLGASTGQNQMRWRRPVRETNRAPQANAPRNSDRAPRTNALQDTDRAPPIGAAQ